jgi:hypothetical protein
MPAAIRCGAAILELPRGSNPTAVLAELCADQRFDLARIVIDRPHTNRVDPASIRTRCDDLLAHLNAIGLANRHTAEVIDSILAAEPDTARTLLHVLTVLVGGSSPLIIRVRSTGQPDFVIPPGFLNPIHTLFGVRVETLDDPTSAGAIDIMRSPPHRYADDAGLRLLEVLACPDEDLGESWSRWLRTETLDELVGFTLVAPILEEQLLRTGIQNEETGRLSGIRRRAWYTNSLKIADVSAVITALRSSDVAVVITGGLVDAIDAATRGSVRAIEGPSLLIDLVDALRAIDVLHSINPELSPDTLRTKLRPPLALAKTSLLLPVRGGRSLHLHWRWLPDRAANRVPLIAEDIKIIDLDGSPVQALTPTPRLIELVAGSVRPAPRPAFTTRVRTMELIDRHRREIDWARVQWACERIDLSAHFRELITSLPDRSRALVPVPF